MNREPIRKWIFAMLVALLGLLTLFVYIRHKPSTTQSVEAGEYVASAQLDTNQAELIGEPIGFVEAVTEIDETIRNNSTVATNIPFDASPVILPIKEESIVSDSYEQAETNSSPVFPIPFTNSLGMRFVVVPGTAVLFSVWETRVQDYQAFVTEKNVDWPKPTWPIQNFKQDATHPAVMVSWQDAKAFCAWLTDKDRREGQFGANVSFRLPTAEEWSVAGCGAKSGNETLFPWGNQWPPPSGVANYKQRLGVDNFPYTSPVESFAANQFGLYDMAGNISEWCDVLPAPKPNRPFHKPVRGGSWASDDPRSAACSHDMNAGYTRNVATGFRVVLAVNLP